MLDLGEATALEGGPLVIFLQPPLPPSPQPAPSGPTEPYTMGRRHQILLMEGVVVRLGESTPAAATAPKGGTLAKSFQVNPSRPAPSGPRSPLAMGWRRHLVVTLLGDPMK